MTNEIKKEQTPQLSPLEQQALDQGWRPLEQFKEEGGDETAWRPAREFIDRGELFAKIEDIKRENRNLRKTLTSFKEHHEKVREVEYKRALEALKQEKKAALIDGDADAVIAIDEKILTTREALQDERRLPKERVEEEINPQFQAWVQHNSWYNTDTELKEFADSTGFAIKARHPEFSPEKILKEVEKVTKRAFPDKFTNPRKEAATSVEEGGAPRKRQASEIELTDDEQRVMKRLVKQGVLTEDQYRADIKALRGVN